MGSITPMSKSQKRALSLLLSSSEKNSYESAATALEDAGYRPTGLPAGHDWRSAAKLADEVLVDLLNRTKIDDEEARTADPLPDGWAGIQ
ncbi:MAG: hypothetical protein EPN45_13550 [Rhizobiaceae bacterium]|nr:MAG: hypothetical protein EPN45_13550 [Rhizobiaceae bacterium]